MLPSFKHRFSEPNAAISAKGEAACLKADHDAVCHNDEANEGLQVGKEAHLQAKTIPTQTRHWSANAAKTKLYMTHHLQRLSS